MLDTLIASFQTYYGLDWASMALGFAGLYLITEKKRIGFLFAFVGFTTAVAAAVLAGQYGFIVANCINLVLMVRGYLKWSE